MIKPTFVAVTKKAPVYDVTTLNESAPVGARIGWELEIVGWELVESKALEVGSEHVRDD